jgi:asparagine synthase (glutamine-hydrolysing)
MCGITGIIDIAQRIERHQRMTTVRRMNKAIHYRGPDGEGIGDFGTASVAMRRLAIIDIAGGDQPIYNEDRSICIFFNGEIYNFQEIRTDLLRKGHQFSTNSDTETIVHLYEEVGLEAPKYLKGMFSFCICDLAKKRYFLARDRFGEKPLFYHWKDHICSFSSEIKSLLECREIYRQLDYEAFHYYLHIGIVPEPLTMFKDIFSLLPGHSMTIDESGLKTMRYFEPIYQPDENIRSDSEAVEFIRPFMENAVKRQMISEVPLGAFLSGGIDSSTIVALLQQQSTTPISTFTVRFEDAGYDESPIAREVAQKLGTNHTEITIPDHGFQEDWFWNILDHTGLPFRDTSAIPTYIICKEIRRHVTVALSGDGGDELFGGYDLFQWWNRIHRLKSIPYLIRKSGLVMTEMAASLPGLNKISLIRQARKALDFSMVESDEMPVRIQAIISPPEFDQVLLKPSSFQDLTRNKTFWNEATDYSMLRKIMWYRLKHNLPENMLVKVDRMAMANSLEVRAPFLDVDLFEASAKLPDRFLIREGKGKFVIREMMKNSLPQSVFDHPKQGFAIPMHRFQNQAFKDLTEKLFSPQNPISELLSLNTLKGWKDMAYQTQQNNASVSVYGNTQKLWSLMMLFGWAERYEVNI